MSSLIVGNSTTCEPGLCFMQTYYGTACDVRPTKRNRDDPSCCPRSLPQADAMLSCKHNKWRSLCTFHHILGHMGKSSLRSIKVRVSERTQILTCNLRTCSCSCTAESFSVSTEMHDAFTRKLIFIDFSGHWLIALFVWTLYCTGQSLLLSAALCVLCGRKGETPHGKAGLKIMFFCATFPGAQLCVCVGWRCSWHIWDVHDVTAVMSGESGQCSSDIIRAVLSPLHTTTETDTQDKVTQSHWQTQTRWKKRLIISWLFKKSGKY